MKWGEWKPQFSCAHCLGRLDAAQVHALMHCPLCRHFSPFPNTSLMHRMHRVRDERKPIWVFWRKARYEREQVYG